MKKLVKSGICGSINSTRVHCSPWKIQQMRAKKKKKRGKRQKWKRRGTETLKPNGYLISFFLVKLYYYTYLSSQPHIPQEIMSSSRSWMLTKIGKKCKIKNWSVLHFSVFINVMPLWRTKITKLIITLYLWRHTNLEDMTLIGDAIDWSKSLVNCNFNWVRRELRASASIELKI